MIRLFFLISKMPLLPNILVFRPKSCHYWFGERPKLRGIWFVLQPKTIPKRLGIRPINLKQGARENEKIN
jgi:hypothetical protein